MKLNLAVCDDDKKDISVLAHILENYSFARNIDLKISTFSSGKDLLLSFKNPGDYHVLLLDVEMPETDGISLAETIRKSIDRNIIIVFISNYPKYMQDSFRVHPFHYLTKPATPDMVYDLMDNVTQEITDSHIICTLISTDERELVINIRDILYIEVSDGKNGILDFHFAGKSIFTKGTLSHWKNELKDCNFYQCYRSILLNLSHIHYFDKQAVILDNGEKIPVGRACEKELRSLYLNHTVRLINL